MVPPTGPLNLDVEAISGICGSISIACWVVVFSPQIVENFRRSSADGLSLQFLIVWLAGDVFNILGAVLQGVLPTMIILAVYYTIADIVLLCQCFYYRGFTWKDEVIPPKPKPTTRAQPNEHTALIPDDFSQRERRGSDWSNNLTHFSPAVPFTSETVPSPPPPPPTVLQKTAWNALAILMVCGAGVAGWWLSRGYSQIDKKPEHPKADGDLLEFNLWGQIFGYLCAVLYLGSRLPQILLNFRRKSTEGVSMLFFLFACLGNLTYVLSIFAYEPVCHRAKCKPGEASHIYGQYILVNLSWLAGSLGTLLLDMGIFIQFFLYKDNDGASALTDVEEYDEDAEDEDETLSDHNWDQRPLLQRGTSDNSR